MESFEIALSLLKQNTQTNRNSGEIFLSIKESCSECKSKIHIYYQNESIDDPTLYISTFDSREIAHDKKQ